MLKIFAAAMLSATLATAAFAQEHSSHMAAPEIDLPAICVAQAGEHGAMPAMPSMSGGGDQAHKDLMAGMDRMNTEMMAGGTAADIDVAFVCSMIPHHRGAIDMAKAEIAHGDDPWAKELAQAIVTAQEKEIADMLAWLEKQPQ